MARPMKNMKDILMTEHRRKLFHHKGFLKVKKRTLGTVTYVSHFYKRTIQNVKKRKKEKVGPPPCHHG